MSEIDRLIAVMAALRHPETGCPWDLAQDFRSIAPYTIEEAYEVADAIERGAMDELRDELGDLLLQVVYHARMAEEAGLFAFDDVAKAITVKMIRRHPHVFGEDDGREGRRDKTAGEQVADWENAKARERAAAARTPSALDGVAIGLPGLTRAAKLQKRAARVGFDWPEIGRVVDKIAEEAGELAAEQGGDRDRIEDEFGDLLFSVVNLGRWLDVEPEAAMRRVNAKFERRFRSVEAALAAEGKRPETVSLAEMDALWEKAKRDEQA